MAHVRFAVVGVGCIGLEHIRNIALLPDAARVVAIVDTSREMLRDAALLFPVSHPPVKQFARVDELFDDMQSEVLKVDAILIATPNFSHFDIICAALQRTSAHLLIEKPLCTTVEDCLKVEEMQKADKHAGSRVIWVGMEYRFIPSIAQLIQETEAGKIGDPKMLAIREHRFPFLRKVGHWNRFNRYSGGTLVEKCCHFFDLMRCIIRSRPVRVIASGSQDVEYKQESYVEERTGFLTHAAELSSTPSAGALEKPDILDNAYVIVEFENGVRALLDLCMFAENSLYQEEVSVVGTKGKLEAFGSKHGQKKENKDVANYRLALRPQSATWCPTSNEPPPVDLLPPIVEQHICVSDPRLLEAGAHEGSTFHEVRIFCEIIKGNTSLQDQLVSVEDGRWAVAIGVAAQESIRKGSMPVAVLAPSV